MAGEATLASPAVLIVWDYDWSLIDTNSDTFVVEQLRPELMSRFRDDGRGWTEIMDWQFEGLFEAGVSQDDIVGCVSNVPISNGCFDAVKLAAANGVMQMVLSDANTVFIDSFLVQRGIRDCFKEVISNPADFDAHGRLHVRPYHSSAPHDCPLCPSNLCKGSVINRIRTTLAPETCIIYVGDGGGDFCPACELRPGDAVLCRAPPSPPLTSFGLHKRIERLRSGHDYRTRWGDAATLTAAVHFWHSGDDVASNIARLIGVASVPTVCPL